MDEYLNTKIPPQGGIRRLQMATALLILQAFSSDRTITFSQSSLYFTGKGEVCCRGGQLFELEK